MSQPHLFVKKRFSVFLGFHKNVSACLWGRVVVPPLLSFPSLLSSPCPFRKYTLFDLLVLNLIQNEDEMNSFIVFHCDHQHRGCGWLGAWRLAGHIRYSWLRYYWSIIWHVPWPWSPLAVPTIWTGNWLENGGQPVWFLGPYLPAGAVFHFTFHFSAMSQSPHCNSSPDGFHTSPDYCWKAWRCSKVGDGFSRRNKTTWLSPGYSSWTNN